VRARGKERVMDDKNEGEMVGVPIFLSAYRGEGEGGGSNGHWYRGLL
jgi:hypothetical protein